jgi:deoxyribonuclease V
VPFLRVQLSHPWDLAPRDAMRLQEALRERVELRDRLAEVSAVGGVDVGFEDQGRTARAAVVVLGYPSLVPLDYAVARAPVTFPYVPGLLSFREIPVVLQALERLGQAPQLLLCDGQGYAHPRRLGIASHLGIICDLPTIGVAKTLLIGKHEPVPDERGAWRPLMDRGEVVGAALRTRAGVAPIYVSAGHRVSLETALRYVMGCVDRYRLPETTRWAHRLASHPERGTGKAAWKLN